MTGPAIPHLMNHKPSNYKWAFEKTKRNGCSGFYKNLDKEGMAWVINACEQCLLLSYRADASLYNALPAHELLKTQHYHRRQSIAARTIQSGCGCFAVAYPTDQFTNDKTADEFWEDELLKGLVEIEEK